MSRTAKGIGTAYLALAMCSSALAQQQKIFGPGVLLLIPEVKRELKITDEQDVKLKSSLEKLGMRYNADFKNMKNKPFAEQREAIRAFCEATYKVMGEVLGEKQMKRFKQIEWQKAGPNAFLDHQLQQKLQLSDEQKKRLESVVEEMNKKMKELFQSRNREGFREKGQKITDEAEEKSNRILTEEQKKRLNELMGEPFKESTRESRRRC